jgi:hypothetical protein
VLDARRTFTARMREHVANEPAATLAAIEHAMHGTKREVSAAVNKCATALCGTLAEPDLKPHISVLVLCMVGPAVDPGTLASATLVAEVTATALALLVRALDVAARCWRVYTAGHESVTNHDKVQKRPEQTRTRPLTYTLDVDSRIVSACPGA